MTYKIKTAGIDTIKTPVVVVLPDGERTEFQNGEELAGYSFDKKYKVDGICVSDGKIEIKLEEMERVVGNEEESFF